MEILANHFQFGNNNPNPASGDASSETGHRWKADRFYYSHRRRPP